MAMNVRDLETTTRALNKAVGAKEPPAAILSMMDTLKKGGIPTEEMLRSTKAGVLIGKLRTNENKEVSRAANELVLRWKKAVEAEKKRRAQPAASASAPASGSPARPAATATSSATSTATPSAAVTTTAAAATADSSSGSLSKGETFKGDPDKRKHKTDGVDVNRTSSNVRNNCIGLMYDGLAYRSTENIDDVMMKAMACEKAVFEKFGREETTEYKTKLRSLYLTLRAKTNKELGVKIMSGDISPTKLASMSSDELKSEQRKREEEKLQKENINNAQVPAETRSISVELQCGKCNMRQVAYSQAQTRSADEPMTTFCECMNCGNRWKFS